MVENAAQPPFPEISSQAVARVYRANLRRLSGALLDTYGIVLTALIFLWILIGESTWPVQMLISLMPGILIPALLLGGLGILLRRKRLILSVIVPVLTFIILYGSFLLPRTTADAPSGSLRVMTFNTHTEELNLAELAALIRAADADIVALQELNEATAAYFADELIAEYPHQVSETNGRSVLGRGILSRYRILHDSLAFDGDRPVHLRAEIDFRGERIALYNIHLSPPNWGISFDGFHRRSNAQVVIESAKKENLPLILLGDFNSTDQTADYRLFAERYSDAFRQVGRGLGPTFPDFGSFGFPYFLLPLTMRLDYVFYSGHFSAYEALAWPDSAASDHRPVVALLSLEAP